MNKRILVIEDNPGCEIILRRVIHSLDPKAAVDCEESGERAVVALEKSRGDGQQSYDLIIADIFLAGRTTGIELWERYKDRFPDTPMLIISSLPAHRFFDSIGRNSIAPAFLPKPFHIGECRQMIEGLLAYH
jgi:CheY-like chemotaxis protein